MANAIKLLGILCLGFGVTGLSAQAKPAWQAGVAKTMITPVKPRSTASGLIIASVHSNCTAADAGSINEDYYCDN